MKQKRCGDCGRRRLVRFFAKCKAKGDGLQGVCKDCGRERSKDYYRRNTERHKREAKRINRESRARNRQFIYDYLIEHPCVDCGKTNPLVLQFDHVRGEKKADVSTLARNACSVRRIEAEIEKCDVRCADCHTIKTLLDQSDFWREKYEEYMSAVAQ